VSNDTGDRQRQLKCRKKLQVGHLGGGGKASIWGQLPPPLVPM